MHVALTGRVRGSGVTLILTGLVFLFIGGILALFSLLAGDIVALVIEGFLAVLGFLAMIRRQRELDRRGTARGRGLEEDAGADIGSG